MKKVHFASIFALLFMFTQKVSADVNFSGMVGGSIGARGESGPDAGFEIPFNIFGAAQFNFGSWGIFRSNIELNSKNMAAGNIFTGQDASLKMNELSFVLTKNSGTIKNYFGFYFGTYEVVGKDDFMQRQLGIIPVTSLLTKSETTLSCGLPLYQNYGIGFSYTANFSKAPGTAGFNLYFNMTDNSTVQLNLDLRTAWATKYLTVDLAAGIGAPLQNKYMGADVILLIDTLYIHGGISVLLGNNYTHSLFIQAGIQNVPITPGSFPKTFDNTNDLYILVEPRIYTKNIKSRLTFYNIPESAVSDMLYLNDPLGVAFSIYSDTISLKNSNMTFGFHFIGSIKDKNLITFINNSSFSPDKNDFPGLNIYCTPFIDFSVGNGDLEVMGQIGVCDVINSPYVQYKIKVGYRKSF